MEENIWESIYRGGENIALAPYTEVFSFLARHYGDDARGKKLLEVGCGVGNNLVFARWQFGFDVYGIDRSPTAIALAKKRFEKHDLRFEALEQGDVISLNFDDDYFDVVIDRAAIQHNIFENARRIVSEIHRVLKPSGLFYSSLTSDSHYLFGKGKHCGGGGDYLFSEENEGIRHFYSRSEVLEIFSGFEILRWYHVTRRELPSNVVTSTVYHVEMVKR